MSDVLISILRGETEEEITEKVLNFKKSMTELDIKNMVKTREVKNLTKYIYQRKEKETYFLLVRNTNHVNHNYVQ